MTTDNIDKFNPVGLWDEEGNDPYNVEPRLTGAMIKVPEGKYVRLKDYMTLREQILNFPNLTMMREAMIETADQNKALREELDKVKRDLLIQVAVNDLAYRPHQLLVEQADSLRTRLANTQERLEAAETALRSATTKG